MVSGPGYEALAHPFLLVDKGPVCCVRRSSQRLLVVLLQQLLGWSSSRSLGCLCAPPAVEGLGQAGAIPILRP